MERGQLGLLNPEMRTVRSLLSDDGFKALKRFLGREPIKDEIRMMASLEQGINRVEDITKKGRMEIRKALIKRTFRERSKKRKKM